MLVTGGAGLVAAHLLRSAPPDHAVELTWHEQPPPDGFVAHRIDLTDADSTRTLVESVSPDVVVHTAYSMTARAAIVDATANIAAGCRLTGAALVHLSTDSVFAGDDPPYIESDVPRPVTDYGRWKLEAEQVARAEVPDVCIIRTSLVVSLDPPDGATTWLLDAVRGGDRPTLFVDEWRTPVPADDLAAALWWLIESDRADRAGIRHLPGPEVLSRWQLGERVVAALGLGDVDALARRASIEDHPTPRCADLTLRSERPWPGEPPRRVP